MRGVWGQQSKDGPCKNPGFSVAAGRFLAEAPYGKVAASQQSVLIREKN
jgi:hypothetical protein